MLFLTIHESRALHARSLAEHGGADGEGDTSALEAAVVAAENRFLYEEADAVACAAAYGFHLTQAHAFVDGNKRVGAAAAATFLALNGLAITVDDRAFARAFLAVAAARMSRVELEAWLRKRVRPR